VNEAWWKVELTTWPLEYIYLSEDLLSKDDGTRLHVGMFRSGPQVTNVLPSMWFELYGFWIIVYKNITLILMCIKIKFIVLFFYFIIQS